jgi:glycosyltransferase involved in cell wall biosynthesis
VCATGYGVVTANLLWGLVEEAGEQNVTLLPIGPMDSTWFPDKVKEATKNAALLEESGMVEPDVTLAIWHEWDHPVRTPELPPGRFAGKYVAMPTFELDRVKPEAVGCLSKCWRVLVSSEHCRVVLERMGLKNVGMTWFHGVHTEIFKPMSKNVLVGDPTFRMVNVGKMEYRKGHDLCIDALAYLLSKDRKAELWALWNNPFVMPESRRRMIVDWMSKSSVEFKVPMPLLWENLKMVGPYPSPQNVAARVNLCDLALYPFRAEGWNLPLLEALACGKPTIASYNTGPRSYLNERNAWCLEGVPVEANDGRWFGPTKLSGKWHEPDRDSLLNFVDEAYDLWAKEPDRIVTAAVEDAKEFTWERAAKRVISWLDTECASSS